jgi:hypothetical protein
MVPLFTRRCIPLFKDVRIWFIVPQKLYSRVVYLSALTISGTRNQDAVNFFSSLRSSEARAMIAKIRI